MKDHSVGQDPLTILSISPEQTIHITGRRRKRLINFMLRWEHYAPALDCLDRMLALSPQLVGLLDAKTEALLGLGRVDDALETIQSRHQLRRSLPSSRLEVRIHLARGDVSTPLKIASELTSERPGSVMAWGMLGEVNVARSEFGAALEAYRKVDELRPSSRSYLQGMLALFQAQGDYVSASAYAVRLQRSAAAGAPLTAAMLRQLRDYYRASGEANRVRDMISALQELYTAELEELRAVLADDLKILVPRRERATPSDAARAAAEPEPVTQPEPLVAAHTPTAVELRQLTQAAQDMFGHSGLLPGQAETLVTAQHGCDVLAVLPTGGGKSLCYQMPALLDETGTTLVISPLIALMKDQVESLPASLQRRATTINSSLDGNELHRRMRDVAAGRYRLVYAAPERLRQPPFLHALRKAPINRLVIDEAHCLSVWGHDFRPDYLYIAQARAALDDPPLLALTATAPPRVRRDILQRLETEPRGPGGAMRVATADVYRPNLYLAAVHARNLDEKLQCLLALCQSETGSGIVYVDTRARSEQIAELLREHGISAGFYHAGIGDRRARAAAQDRFMQDQIQVIVATVAFGMGIDKKDIRFIIHFRLPPSLESYYQEAGRAGRDGQPSHCILIYSSADRGLLTRRARGDALPIEFLRTVYSAVKRRLGETSLGRVAMGDLMRDVQADDTPVRVALSTLEEAGLLRRHQDLPCTAVVRLLNKGAKPPATPPKAEEAEEPAWEAFVRAARLRPGQSLPLDPVAVAGAAGLDPTTIESHLLAWADDGRLDYRAAGRDPLLELLPPPDDAATRVETLIDRYATIQVQRVDEIVAYAVTRRCRHAHISAYLGGAVPQACHSCDNCAPDLSPIAASVASLDLPDQLQQLLTVLQCAATAPWSWGQTSLVNILHGNSRAPEKGRASPKWGALSFRSKSAVKGMVVCLTEAGLLRPRTLGHGGVVLDLTPEGRAAINEPARLASLIDAG